MKQEVMLQLDNAFQQHQVQSVINKVLEHVHSSLLFNVTATAFGSFNDVLMKPLGHLLYINDKTRQLKTTRRIKFCSTVRFDLFPSFHIYC